MLFSKIPFLFLLSIFSISCFGTLKCYAKNLGLVPNINHQSSKTTNSEQIRISGSSTLYPFISLAGERYSSKYNKPIPIAESIGTGGGFNNFCSSDGLFRPHIVSASRKIKPSEVLKCKQNDIDDIKEVAVGYDAIVLAEGGLKRNPADAPLSLTTKEIFLAISKYIPQNGKLVENPYKLWSDINPKLPSRQIVFYGPPSTSGTRDSFVDLVFLPNCLNDAVFAAKFTDEAELKKQCSRFRNDGVFIDVGENDNITIRKIGLSKDAIGILGYDYFNENKNTIRSVAISGQNIYDQNQYGLFNNSYPLLRILYLYTRLSTLAQSKSTNLFLQEVLSDAACGADGYLTDANLIPLEEAYRKNTLLNLDKAL